MQERFFVWWARMKNFRAAGEGDWRFFGSIDISGGLSFSGINFSYSEKEERDIPHTS